jgi:divalent metal cation (Fe/Co/Zn/Cd) transporter
VAVSFGLLSVYVAVNPLAGLIGGRACDASLVGVVLVAVSLAVMPVIARAKRRMAPAIGSRAEAAQTDLCSALSAALLVRLGLNLTLGWWWADPLAALVIAAIAGYAAVTIWSAPPLADTSCT